MFDKKAYNRAHYLAHKAEIQKRREGYMQKYYLANKDKIAAYQRAYMKVYRLTHKAEKKVYAKAYRSANQEELSAYGKAYRKANPEKCVAKRRKYRALKRGNAHNPYKDIDIFERDNWICGICGQKINKRLKHPNPRSKSIDHIMPLSRGGNDTPINVQAAHLRCNLSKYAGGGGQLRLIG